MAKPVAPPSSVTVSATVYVPAAAYACDTDAPLPEAPSPKSHAHDTTDPSASEDPDPSNDTDNPDTDDPIAAAAEVVRLVDDRVHGRATTPLGDRESSDRGREVLGRVLLHESLGLDATGEPLDGERPSGEQPQHPARDQLIVAHNLGLGDAMGREDQPVRARYLHSHPCYMRRRAPVESNALR